MRMIIALALLLPLSGCTALFGPGDYQQYSQALQTHSETESARIQAQSGAIASAAIVPTATPTERALLATIAMMQIERLQPTPLGIVKPTTGMDVLGKTVDTIPFLAGMGGMYALGREGIRAAGNVEIGENANVSGSLNKPVSTSVGSSNTATVQPYEVRPEVVEPTIIQPQP